MPLQRIIVLTGRGSPGILFKIIDLETAAPQRQLATLSSLFANGDSEKVVWEFPSEAGKFHEVMYPGDPTGSEQETIIELCAKKGVIVTSVAVGHRYYGQEPDSVTENVSPWADPMVRHKT